MTQTLRSILCAAAVGAALLSTAAPSVLAGPELRLPHVFADHMVLQRGAPVPVWGWAAPGDEITVGIAKKTVHTTANAAGEWKTELPPLAAGGPFVLSVSGASTVRFEDVLIGDVWLCSGQSNMEMGIGRTRDAAAEIAAADHPRIRLLMVPNHFAPVPQDDFEPSAADGVWKVCSPETVAQGGWSGFSAAGYFFGRALEKEIDVPIGLIDATWGGTVIQTWTPPEGFAQVPALRSEYERVLLADPRSEPHRERLRRVIEETERWSAEARKALADGVAPPPMPAFPPELAPPANHQSATALYNGMVHPLRPYALRGAVWYQGESNLRDGPLYADRMKALVNGWRTVWGQDRLPVYFVQIAPFKYGGEPQLEALLWEAQDRAQEIPDTGMVVTNDIGNLKDIHPTDKQEVGRRLALWALAKTYGKDVLCSGPRVRDTRTEGHALRVTFDDAGAGLRSRDGKPLTWFEIIDADTGGFVPAKARIERDAVLLTAADVKRPVAVRFAWHMLAEPNLVNSAGLPAGAFRAGTVPDRDLLALEVPESKDYTLVYDLDLAKLGTANAYDVDAHARITKPFDRIAYFFELTDANGATQFVYVSMDAFTDALSQIGVPTVASGAHFQQDVTALNVVSNVKGVESTTGSKGGNIEFWPGNYAAANAAKVPGASSSAWDFGDEPSGTGDGYGSMQVHDHDARRTLFALNHWTAGTGADVGIGNQSTGNPDWTFAANAKSYPVKRLRVLVRCR